MIKDSMEFNALVIHALRSMVYASSLQEVIKSL